MSHLRQNLMRDFHCGELRALDIGKKVTLCGWVNKVRDLGGLYFMDVRDKFGLTQLNFGNFKGDPSDPLQLKKATLESVIKITGIVQGRPEKDQNKNMLTGEIEIHVDEFTILSQAKEVPFLPNGPIESSEDLRLKYRYLDLRNSKLQNILSERSKTTLKVRQILTDEGFIEVETPILYKSTPEGARDYLVPSRIHPGKVFALPQSPQILKQLLMIAGTDKYFQICKCFRDEDLRADRQPEFSQIDIEVSFPTPLYIQNLVKKIIAELFYQGKDFNLPTLNYQTCQSLYGSDKPDTRFGLKHKVVTTLFKDTEFATFKSVDLIKALFLPARLGQLSRKDIDALPLIVAPFGGKGVAWFKVQKGERSGGISKFITDEMLSSLTKLQDADESEDSGLWLFVADKDSQVVHSSTDAVRKHLATKLNLYNPNEKYAFLWVNDFPLLDHDEKEGRFYACHHPFTQPHPEDLEGFMKGDKESLKKCKAVAYDLVCNGYELGGGSLRIHDPKVQEQMFKVLGMEKNEVETQFGFFVEALQYGTPPHGGLAFGLDRIMMLLTGTDNIRDVMAFPKTTSATDLMSSCPSAPADRQIKELHFEWKK